MRSVPLLSAVSVLALALADAADAGPGQDYMLYCMGCHAPDAQGLPGKIPPLAGSLGRDYVLRVPGAANSARSDAQLAAVLNWIAARYPDAGEPPPAPFTVEEVTRARRTPLADVKATRREVVRSLAASGAPPPAEY